MLFELYGFLDGEEVNGQQLWEGNLFHSANNINGIDVDGNKNRLGEEFFSLENTELIKIQKAYIEKIVDTLNDLDTEQSFQTKREWQNWFEKNRKQIYFSDFGGFKFRVVPKGYLGASKQKSKQPL